MLFAGKKKMKKTVASFANSAKIVIHMQLNMSILLVNWTNKAFQLSSRAMLHFLLLLETSVQSKHYYHYHLNNAQEIM